MECAENGEVRDIQSTKARALKILGSRMFSAREIEKRLKAKGETEEDAKQAAEWLVSIGAIDDRQYAESIVRHYTSKGYGLARIRDELFKRGIDREMWDEALVCAEGMEEAAVAYLAKKLGGSSDEEDLRKAAAALCRRGFTYSKAHEAINRYLEEKE